MGFKGFEQFLRQYICLFITGNIIEKIINQALACFCITARTMKRILLKYFLPKIIFSFALSHSNEVSIRRDVLPWQGNPTLYFICVKRASLWREAINVKEPTFIPFYIYFGEIYKFSRSPLLVS